MHQVIIYIVCLQPLQLFIEIFVERGARFYKVLRQLCRYIYIFPASQAPEYLAYSDLAARIYIRCVKLINAQLHSARHLALCLIYVYRAAVLRKSHTAVAKYRQRLTVPVVSVIHKLPL